MTGPEDNKKITAVIPTRAGSERVKQKNIRKFGDSNLLELKIESMKRLKRSGVIDEIMLNSNCPVSMEIASRHRIKIHERDDFLASSECDIREYWKECAKHISTPHMLLAQVTSPFISADTYVKCLKAYFNSNHDSLMTVKELKEYIWKDNAPLNYKWPQHPKSQNLPTNIHYLTFGVSIISKEVLAETGNLVGQNPLFYPVSQIEAVDIDTEIDFQFAEQLYHKTHAILHQPPPAMEEHEYFHGHGY